jgi:hypothetical protein
LFTRRAAAKTQITRNCQLLTRDPKDATPKAKGPEFVTTVHSQLHRQMRRLEPSPPRLRTFLTIFSPTFSLIPPTRSPISPARPFFLIPTPDIYIRACRTLHVMGAPSLFGSGPLRGAHRYDHRIGQGKEGDGCHVRWTT